MHFYDTEEQPLKMALVGHVADTKHAQNRSSAYLVFYASHDILLLI
uniref:Uncharacterized protein n=1 Tax=Rhizophora mucronata TaxID=61149 RepID=A0A2P2N5I1_RHIMU